MVEPVIGVRAREGDFGRLLDAGQLYEAPLLRLVCTDRTVQKFVRTYVTMFCHVTRPDSVVMTVEVDPKANGEDCLNKVCQRLGIIEKDYFGLQFTGSKGESLWLNLRNRISRQADNVCPCRLKLRVKFFVEPHLILQEQTRHLFLMHAKEELVQGSLCLDPEQVVELCALLAQAEFGDYSQGTARYFCTQIYGQDTNPSTVNSIIARHKELRGVSHPSAEYQALQLVSTLENYGVEWHWARDAEGHKMAIGVGPEGLSVCKQDFTPVNRFTYPAIQMATQSGKNVYVTITKDGGDHLVLLFKFISASAASGLYRAITEIHAFYRCDTVTSTVMMQYSRDFRGHLASLFLNESVDVGKKYIFDVQRTSKEAYDRARRTLFHSSALSPPKRLSEKEVDVEGPCEGCRDSRVLRDKLQRVQEALTCALCCDREIDTAFCPCGHMVCCRHCAAQLQCCPVCRTEVGQVQPVYLPTCASLLGLPEPCGNDNSEHRELDPHSDMPQSYRSDQAFLSPASSDFHN